jgi:hypothetical protein
MYPRLFPWVRLGWLLALLRGRIPYPVLVLNGERREFGEITVRVIREGPGCLVRTRTTARIITRACLQSSSDAAFRKSRIEGWRGSMVSLQTRPNRNDHRQGTRPFSWIPTTLKGATLKGESHIIKLWQAARSRVR